MNNLIQYKHSLTVLAVLLVSISVFGQKKYVESYKATSDKIVKLNTAYTQIIFESWDKDKIEIEALIDGDDLSAEEKQQLFDEWEFSISENDKEVTVTSLNRPMGGPFNDPRMDALSGMSFTDPFMSDFFASHSSMFSTPGMPEGMLSQMSGMNFDYEAFQKNPQAYMEAFEKKMLGVEKEGMTSEDRMKEMESQMEGAMKKMEEQFKNNGMDYTQKVVTDANGNKTYIIEGSSNKVIKRRPVGKKTLIIRMPKKTATEINVRHGEIRMASASNVKATLNYAPFKAESIDGDETNINAAYAPVVINDWKNGKLYVKFVDRVTLNTVGEINLTSNSSGVIIGTLGTSAKISSAFGTLRIDNVNDNFKKIDLQLDNTNTAIVTPSSAFNVSFNGKRSSLRYNKNIELSQRKQYDRVLVDGYHKSRDAERELLISAAYSNLVLQ
ncbi:hypothetical protein SCB49_01929 [unidentified eubacterium SCB49]|nr:hypothetical protein SCB49_01929 [unidentified eubacterium SCB49]